MVVTFGKGGRELALADAGRRLPVVSCWELLLTRGLGFGVPGLESGELNGSGVPLSTGVDRGTL